MQTALIIIGITSASLAGSAFGYWSLEQVEQRKLRTSYLLQAGAAAERPGSRLPTRTWSCTHGDRSRNGLIR